MLGSTIKHFNPHTCHMLDFVNHFVMSYVFDSCAKKWKSFIIEY
jgi:hypothetical protein